MVAIPPIWTPLRYHETQQKAWKCDKRFVALPCGRGSGKTELARRKLVMSLPIPKPWPTPRYFYGAPTREQARRISWDVFKKMIPANWLDGEPSESRLVIRTIFGSELHVVGLDKPQRLEGDQWDGGVLDESCDLRPGAFDLSILPAMAWRNGWVWRIGVPKRTGMAAEEFRTFFEDAKSGKLADAAGFSWPSSDLLTPEQLAYAQEHMDPTDYAEQFDAIFQRSGGGIYGQFDDDANVRPCKYNPDMAIVVGSDFNVDPMAWIIGHKYENRIEVIDELWVRNINTPKMLDILYERYSHHKNGFVFYGDATGRARKTSAAQSDYNHIGSHEGFRQSGCSVRYPRSNPAVVDRYAAVNALLCNAASVRRLFIDPSCKRLRLGLRSDAYKPGTREPETGGDRCHIGDALGYLVYACFPIRIPLTYSVPEVILT